MKRSASLLLLVALHSFGMAAEPFFPGLKNVMTEAEWSRAGLDRLTPDQIGVIDAALIKYHIQAARIAASPPAPAPVPSAPPATPANATPAEAAAAKSKFWERFGLAKLGSSDWRNQPPMTAKVTAWRGSNGFVLDNGQVWEGLEQIPFDLPGNTITIEARPLDAYALKLNENTVTVRVRRLR